MRAVLVGAAVLFSSSPAWSQALPVVEVGAPAINCVFHPNCTVAVSDTIGEFAVPGGVGTGRLQSRTFQGEPGAAAEGLFGYEYRVDLGGVSGQACIASLSLDFGPPVALDYNGDQAPDRVYVVTAGALGSVGLSGAEAQGRVVTFRFAGGVCAGQSSFFVGVASHGAPRSVVAEVTEASTGAAVAVEARAPAIPPGGKVELSDDPSGIALRLDRMFYESGQPLRAKLDLGAFDTGDTVAGVVVVAPGSGDLEVLRLDAVGGGRFETHEPLTLSDAAGGTSAQLDGVLSAVRGEMFVALYYVNREKLPRERVQEDVVSDFGILRDPALPAPPHQTLAELALTEDERKPPPGAKPLGTLLRAGQLPVQVAADELVVFPRDARQLERFLELTGGVLLASDVLPEEEKQGGGRPPSAYLVRVDLATAPLSDLPQIRALLGEKETLYGSSEAVLRLYALALHAQLEGFVAGVNPRLLPHGAPTASEESSCGPNCDPADRVGVSPNMRMGPAGCDPAVDLSAPVPGSAPCPLQVPKLWAFNALWEADTRTVAAAILDMGFAPNPDFRTPAGGLVQCDMEGRSLADIFRGFRCAPGSAEGPPTVGNSFFGERSWHGTGVVTTAGGVVNNAWGAAGVAGQLAVPMLYRFGLSSYAFEMGLGIRKATLDGASCINLSAGYPCRILDNIGIDFNICSVGGRAALCAAATATLVAATAVVCASAAAVAAIPIVGPALAVPLFVACAAAGVATAVASTACFATLIAGDLRGPLQAAVDFATEQGVPVVTIAGNNINAANLPPIIRDLIDVDERRVEAWEIIPAMMPQTIVVGATSDNWPFTNQHFFGNRVDVWAPIRTNYWAPPSTGATAPPPDHVKQDIGGTSAATPYVAGVVAAMQAVQPSLNPRTPGLSAALRRTIPERVKALLTSTAFNLFELVGMAPAGALRDQTLAAGSERRNLVDPFRAIQAAAAGSLPDFAALGYDRTLNFNERDAATSADRRENARLLSLASTHAGTIISIRGEDGAPTLSDADWFRFLVPAGVPGVFEVDLRLRMPSVSRFGRVQVSGAGYRVSGLPAPSPVESEFLVTSGPLFNGAEDRFRVHGFLEEDNLYQITLAEFRRIGDLPDADRFDRNDPAVNPPESRPDNDVMARGVHLGASGEFVWDLVSSGSGGDVFGVTIAGLNFHDTPDTDWFEVIELPDASFFEGPGCRPELTASADRRARVRALTADGTVLAESRGSTLTLAEGWVPTPLFLSVEPVERGRFVEYDLVLRFRRPNERICELAAIGAAIEEAAGAREHGFPSFLPELERVDGFVGPALPQFRRGIDELGRIDTPELYGLEWRGGDFQLVGQLLQGPSLELQLLGSQGQEVAYAATLDHLMDRAGPQGGGDPLAPASREAAAAELPAGDATLVLAAEALPEGSYLLVVGGGTLKTQFSLTLPAGAVFDGSPSVEDCLAGFCAGVSGDRDLDGLPDAEDVCPDHYDPKQLDSDGDGVGDACDNCGQAWNPLQENANADLDDDSSREGLQRYGDACDVDLDDDGLVGASDFFGVLRPCLGQDLQREPGCRVADLDGDGVVGASDFFGRFRPALGRAPGPGVTE